MLTGNRAMTEHWQTRLSRLIKGLHQGMYLEIEVAAQIIDFVPSDAIDEAVAAVSPQIAHQLHEWAIRFAAGEQMISIGGCNPLYSSQPVGEPSVAEQADKARALLAYFARSDTAS